MKEEHINIKSVLKLREFLKDNLDIEYNQEIPSLNIKLKDTEIEYGRNELLSLFNNEKETICLFTHATGEKCFSEEWWLSFYEKLKVTFYEYNFLEILPIENISKLNFCITTYYSTDIRKIASILSNCKIFIGADSGMMHLASASQTITIGLFKVTEMELYSPYNNLNTSFNTNFISQYEIIESISVIIKKSDLL
jgi:heptosyltransferase-3